MYVYTYRLYVQVSLQLYTHVYVGVAKQFTVVYVYARVAKQWCGQEYLVMTKD